eukprot:2647449-Pleurochrysis_carterae.AAC.3
MPRSIAARTDSASARALSNALAGCNFERVTGCSFFRFVLSQDGISAILIRHETSPEDVAGMCAAEPSSMSYMQLTTVKRFVFFSSK